MIGKGEYEKQRKWLVRRDAMDKEEGEDENNDTNNNNNNNNENDDDENEIEFIIGITSTEPDKKGIKIEEEFREIGGERQKVIRKIKVEKKQRRIKKCVLKRRLIKFILVS